MDLNRFIQHSRKAILLLCAGLCIAGYYCFTRLPVAIFPELSAPRIIVTSDDGDTPIPAVVSNITLPLENALAGVPDITKLQSLTVRGSDELDVNFAWGTNMATTLQLVNAKIAQLQPTLPAGTLVQAERLNPSVFPIMGYSLYSNTTSPEDLRRLALYTLRPALQHIPGVQQITVMGGDTPEFLVQASPSALIARGISIGDVETAIAKANEISEVGYFDEDYQRHDILVNGLFRDASDIAGVTIAVKNGVPVTVGQVAVVSRSDEPHKIETSGDGHPAVLIDVIKQPSGNSVEIAKAVAVTIDSLHRDIPAGVTLSNYYDQSQIVLESQSSVLEAIVIGGVLTLLVLTLFLNNLRAAAVVLVILPLTILITFVLMRCFGQTLNIMTLGALAIALGLVIDDGIVVVENIVHEVESGHSKANAIREGLRAITPAMLGSSITTMAAFLPLIFLVDLTGQFFGPLAIVMIEALTVSLLLSLLLIPILVEYFFKTSGQAKSVPKVAETSKATLSLAYANLLGRCLGNKPVVGFILLPVALAAVLTASHLQTGFFPDFDEGGFILDYQLPDGTSLQESSSIARGIESILAKTPEVAAWSRRTGAQLGFDITTQNIGDMSIRLHKERSRNIDAVMDDVRGQVNSKYPQAQADFHQILQDNIGDIAGSPSPVEIKIFGPDQSMIEGLAKQVDGIITQVPGVVDDFDGIVHSDPQTVVDVNTEAAERYGFTTDDVSQAASAALQGDEPTHVQVGDEQVGVRVMIAHNPGSESAGELASLPIASPTTGQTVQLSQVAEMREVPGVAQVTREDQRLMIAVTADLSGRDLGSTTRDIQNRIADNIVLPPGCSIEYGGQFASQQQSFSELTLVLCTSSLLVFTLLVFQFRSVRQALAVIIAALLSLSGVVFALACTNTPLNISSFTGAIMIVGIITENGIVLFNFFNHLCMESPAENYHKLMVMAGKQRLRPILMTTVGAILALFPLALGIGAGAALQKPLAIAVIGGLCVSVFFTLIVAPVIYLSIENRQKASRIAPHR
jgi:CzcA family heavy metal efflux pump